MQYPNFVETVQSIVPFWWARLFGGGLYVVGIVMLAINATMTWLNRPSKYEVPVFTAPRLTRVYQDAPIPASRLVGTPVLEAAVAIDKVVKMDWHRRWERLPLTFTVLTTLAVVIASLFEIIPTFLIRANVPTIASVKPYTPLELAGRDIYVSEGCYNCHSQMIRPMIAETQRYGEYSKAGEFIYDRPFQWGSRRIGPDLAREGGRQSSFWHWEHLDNPTQRSPGSVMPSYRHLLLERLNFGGIQERINAVHFLGAPYDLELTDAAGIARKQADVIAAEILAQGGKVDFEGKLIKDSTAIALIAYLQRLGKDLYRVDPPATVVEPPKLVDDTVKTASSPADRSN
jgi:cytochrome c oxidase cbb3-type subunit I/II